MLLISVTEGFHEDEIFDVHKRFAQNVSTNDSLVIIWSRSASRQGKALFSFLFVEKLVRSLVSRVDSLEAKVTSLETSLASLSSVDVEGGLQSYSGAQRNFEAIFSNITNIYDKIKVNRKNINKKCSKKKCERIISNIDKLETSVEFLQDTNITVLEQMVDMIKNSSAVG